MKKIEFYLNVLHFCFYRLHYKSHLFFNKINPFHIIHNLPFQKRKYEELGIDIHKEIDKAFGDKTGGLSILVAGGILLAALFFFFLAIINLFIGLADLNVSLSKEHFITCCILSAGLSYLYIFREDKYIEYFEKFEKWSKVDSRKYIWLTFGFIVLVGLLFIVSIKLQ